MTGPVIILSVDPRFTRLVEALPVDCAVTGKACSTVTARSPYTLAGETLGQGGREFNNSLGLFTLFCARHSRLMMRKAYWFNSNHGSQRLHLCQAHLLFTQCLHVERMFTELDGPGSIPGISGKCIFGEIRAFTVMRRQQRDQVMCLF
uniref:Uncharacterized protein n=1 Tax=Timema douglasi TaxID=61478 RepID=A0A7R8VC58_TIMDO|nr:unnamed protein product [Timema douglasi]